MDEELIEFITEESFDVTQEGAVESAVDIDDIEQTTDAEENNAQFVEIEDEESVEIEMSEAVGWTGGDSSHHNSLGGRDDYDQHPIKAITGLRAELDEIERIKTEYADKLNVANYYKWHDSSYDTYGYFVSIVPNTSTIKICSGSEIFGVSVDSAGFIGGQNQNVPRDNAYGLIVTFGLVDVRCELDVEVGNCVVSNAYGYAMKSDSSYGYKVLARENKHGVEYAVIALGVQADIVRSFGIDLDDVKKQVAINEQQIISATNTANQAYNKAVEIGSSNKEMSDKVDSALGVVDKVESDVKNLESQVSDSAARSELAVTLANTAATSAASMLDDAINEANKAWQSVNDLTKKLDPIVSWTGENGISGADYLATQMDNGIATTYDIKVVEDDLQVAQHAIIRNGKEISSFMTSIDKYAVGPYSQAYGFDLDQAASVLEDGMIYVPTVNKINDDKEIYHYKDSGGNAKTYEREFLRGYLYRWGDISGGLRGWITVDKNYSQDKLNTSAPAVYFDTAQPSIGGDFGYWYTNGDAIEDGYDPYTLYKWETSADKWIPVATLAGNSQSRAVSQIRQDSNSIVSEITNTFGSVAGFGAQISEVEAKVDSIASWPVDGGTHNMAIFEQRADDNGSYMVLAVATDIDGKSEITDIGGAKIILNDSELGSFIQLDADHIDFNAGTYTINADHISLEGLITANGGFVIDEDGDITASNANITGIINASEGEIGEWLIDGTGLCTENLTAFIRPYGHIGSNDIEIAGFKPSASRYWAVKFGDNFGVGINGTVYAKGANIKDGFFTNCTIDENCIINGTITSDTLWSHRNSSIANGGILFVDFSTMPGFSDVKAASYEMCIDAKDGSDFGSRFIIAVATPDDSPSYSYARMETNQPNIDDNTVRESHFFEIKNDEARLQTSWFNVNVDYDIKINGEGTNQLIGTWWCNEAEINDSDRNVKNSIIDMDDSYGVLFDGLRPRMYKYNDGRSDRLHSGFIAQEIKDAIVAAGLTTKDFAAVCVEKSGTEDERWGLRYTEFVALNTHEIQKLKTRVAELEAQIDLLLNQQP